MAVWLDKFPESEAIFLAPGVSDHCAILVTVLPEVRVRRPFKFFNFWLKNSKFKEALVSSWDSPLVSSVRSRLGLKLKRLKPVLKGLNQHYYSDISGRVTQLRMELGQIQAQYQGDPDNIALRDREQEVYLKFVEMSGAEEAFKKQKSRVQWLALGDQNTQFFHHKLKPHCVRNKILSLNTSTGVRLTDPTEIKKEILGYYEGLLGSSFDQKMDAYPALRLALTRKVGSEFKDGLVKAVSREEVKAAMWSIKGDKALGPDGFTSAFFQHYWDVVGSDVTEAILLFFRSGILPKSWNSTVLSLIPKSQAPSTIKDFRPITCCNVVYKCIAKILASRVQAILPGLISPCQSAFIKGKSIVDNILLMQEVVKNYHKNEGSPRCAIKMDIMKAYDSVDWAFLFDIMSLMEFRHQYILWVKVCVSTPMFSITINGQFEGYFPGRKGLRQGDPLSPYLFLLVMEGFSALFQYKMVQTGFVFHPKCQPLQLSHLIFVDDLFVSSGADPQSFKTIQDTLQDFYFFSGLKPNMQKSSIFFAGVSHHGKLRLCNILPIPEGFLPVKYLGVPLISTRLRSADCSQLMDRILCRIQSWTNKKLSYGGRTQLVISVLFSIQVYWSSIFILPQKVLKDIDKMLRAFLWAGPDLKPCGAKVAWSTICTPKEEGGLGFRHLSTWNKAAMSRHI